MLAYGRNSLFRSSAAQRPNPSVSKSGTRQYAGRHISTIRLTLRAAPRGTRSTPLAAYPRRSQRSGYGPSSPRPYDEPQVHHKTQSWGPYTPMLRLPVQ